MALIKAITNNTNLTIGAIRSFLTVNTTSGVTSLTVKNITSFADNQILVVGEFGNEGAELAYVNGSPSGSTLTLDSATTFPHSASSPVIVIDFDQVEFSHSVTTGGAKTVLGNVTIVVDIPDFTRYQDNTYTTGYYFTRFYNSVTGLYSDYSDPIPVDGYGLFTARSIIDDALSQINKTTSPTLSDAFAFQQIDNCQSECLSEFKRWSFMQKFDEIIGQVTTGSWKVAMPTDIDNENTNKSTYQLRIGTEKRLTWVDKQKFDEFLIGVGYSTLSVILNVGDSTMTLVNSGDFDATGTVTIGSYSYDYTANDTDTGVLTLSEVVPAGENQPAGADVFQGVTTGLPQYWTTYGGYIYYLPATSESYDGRNIYMDYYSKQVKITSDATEIVIPQIDVVSYYLQWKFLRKINNGSENDGSLQAKSNFEQGLAKMKQKEVLGTTFKFRPRNQNFANRTTFGNGTPRFIRDGNFPNTGF